MSLKEYWPERRQRMEIIGTRLNAHRIRRSDMSTAQPPANVGTAAQRPVAEHATPAFRPTPMSPAALPSALRPERCVNRHIIESTDVFARDAPPGTAATPPRQTTVIRPDADATAPERR